jgi:hypothetical protein
MKKKSHDGSDELFCQEYDFPYMRNRERINIYSKSCNAILIKIQQSFKNESNFINGLHRLSATLCGSVPKHDTSCFSQYTAEQVFHSSSEHQQ